VGEKWIAAAVTRSRTTIFIFYWRDKYMKVKPIFWI
jgi:hypothetical protein